MFFKKQIQRVQIDWSIGCRLIGGVCGQKEYDFIKALALLCETLYATPIVATTLSFVEANVLSDIET